jgi:nitroreductase
MKIKLSLLLIALLAVMKLNGQTDNAVTMVLLSGYSERAYTSVPVTDQQIDVVLKCGIKTPSAMNKQPWKFTVIKDESTMKAIVSDVLPGNVLIIVSGTESDGGVTPDFDCGLATENMFIAAHGLGLGARIYGGPIRNVVLKRDVYQIPSGYKPVMILRIGNVDKGIDAVSSASPRKSADEVINYKK